MVRPALAAVAALGEAQTRIVSIAGKRIAFRFYGARLAERLSLAFVHNAVANAGAPDLTISVWDSATNGVAMLVPLMQW